MDETKVIEVKQSILWENTQEADQWRQKLAKEGTFFLDVMASPGAGKTTLILALLKELKARGLECGVIEADLESDVDALKIKEAGVASVELNTKGVCHVEMGMVKRSFAAFGDHHFDFMVLENIGNLVCPADFDTGAHTRVMLLSVPEGYDKVYKYPPMFAVTNALIVTKCAYLPTLSLWPSVRALRYRALSRQACPSSAAHSWRASAVRCPIWTTCSPAATA